MNERAAGISFNFLLAIPASLIFLFSLVPFLPLDSVQHTILESIKLLSPSPKLYSAAQNTIIDLMETKRRELISFSILATIFTSSSGVLGLIRSFDRKSIILKERSSIARRGRAILITLVLMVMLIIAIALLISQSHLLKMYILRYFTHPVLIQIVSWLILVLIIYIAICIVYKYGPSLNSKQKFFSLGASIATISFFIVSYGFFYFASHFIHYNKIYGSIGTLLMVMIWMFITGLVLLIGFEINMAVITIEMDNLSKVRPVKHSGKNDDKIHDKSTH